MFNCLDMLCELIIVVAYAPYAASDFLGVSIQSRVRTNASSPNLNLLIIDWLSSTDYITRESEYSHDT